MTVTINGTTGIDKVQDGTIQSADFAAGVPARSNLPAGTVLQVVQGTYSTSVGSTSTTYADTGLSASITPTSDTSKILVLVNHTNCTKTSSTSSIGFKILRGASTLVTITNNGDTGSNLAINFVWNHVYLDSPATTSSITYKTQFANEEPFGTVYVQAGNNQATITLMEIAA